MNQLNSQQQWVPAPTGQFFTESPNGGQAYAQPSQLDANQLTIAQKMNVDPAVYAAWVPQGGQRG
jgi:hypothetical protein